MYGDKADCIYDAPAAKANREFGCVLRRSDEQFDFYECKYFDRKISLKKREPRPSINRAHKTKPSKGQLKKDIEKERSTASIGNLISENIASLSEQSQTFGFGDYHRMLCKLIGKIAFRRIGLQL